MGRKALSGERIRIRVRSVRRRGPGQSAGSQFVVLDEEPVIETVIGPVKTLEIGSVPFVFDVLTPDAAAEREECDDGGHHEIAVESGE